MQRIRPLILALGLSVSSILPSAANPLTVAVSNFCEISKGTVLNDACAFFENGSATCALRFFDEKPCTFIVVARGDRGCGAWPELKVRFDGEELFKTRIASADWATYTFVSAGMRSERRRSWFAPGTSNTFTVTIQLSRMTWPLMK